MASLIDNLIAIMDEEAVYYENYLEMANNKKEVIIKGDVPSLQQITHEEEIVAGQLFRLEKKRKSVIEDICTVTNRNPSEFKIKDLMMDLSARPEEGAKLTETAERLNVALQKCKEINRVNKMLIEQSLDFVEFSINAISGLTQTGGPSTYKKGEMPAHIQEKPRFDAKQ